MHDNDAQVHGVAAEALSGHVRRGSTCRCSPEFVFRQPEGDANFLWRRPTAKVQAFSIKGELGGSSMLPTTLEELARFGAQACCLQLTYTYN